MLLIGQHNEKACHNRSDLATFRLIQQSEGQDSWHLLLNCDNDDLVLRGVMHQSDRAAIRSAQLNLTPKHWCRLARYSLFVAAQKNDVDQIKFIMSLITDHEREDHLTSLLHEAIQKSNRPTTILEYIKTSVSSQQWCRLHTKTEV